MNRKITTSIEILLIALSIIGMSIYFYVALSRIAYPFTIEWVESNVFLHVLRVLSGKPIFIPPSYDFIPMIYTPLYYYVAAIFARVTGQIMFSMRLVSIFASLLIFLMIYAFCRVIKISAQSSLIAVGLFAASYAATGFWFDVGRVDTLSLALLLIGYVLTFAQTKRENIFGVIAGIVFFLSFATKQSALFAFPFLISYLLLKRRWMKALWTAISFILSVGLFVVGMNIVSNGWFWIYVFEIPTAHPISWRMVTQDIWISFIFPKFAGLILTIILGVIVLLMGGDRKESNNFVVIVFSFVVPLSIISIVSMGKQWGYLNGLMPIAIAFSVMGGEAYHRSAIFLNNASDWKVLYIFVSASLILQFIAFRYDFRTQIPTRDTWAAGERILDLLRASKDPIFVPTSAYLLYMVGQPTHFQTSSLGDLNLAAQNNPAIMELSKPYLDKINAYLTSNSIKTIILSNANWYDKVFSTENGYNCESLLNNHAPLTTVTGAISYLNRICHFQGEPIQ